MVLARGGLLRPLALSVASLIVLLAGARARLQAPLILGGATLLALAVDTLWPVAAQLPRWVTIGAVGLLLLWLGATAEHRLTQLRDAERRFRASSQTGPSVLRLRGVQAGLATCHEPPTPSPLASPGPVSGAYV